MVSPPVIYNPLISPDAQLSTSRTILPNPWLIFCAASPWGQTKSLLPLPEGLATARSRRTQKTKSALCCAGTHCRACCTTRLTSISAAFFRSTNSSASTGIWQTRASLAIKYWSCFWLLALRCRQRSKSSRAGRPLSGLRARCPRFAHQAATNRQPFGKGPRIDGQHVPVQGHYRPGDGHRHRRRLSHRPLITRTPRCCCSCKSCWICPSPFITDVSAICPT